MEDGRKCAVSSRIPKLFSLLPASIFLLCLFCPITFAVEPFFITIEKVELKKPGGEWVTVIRPDRRLDLDEDEPVVRFFNNGRIAPGEYSNVRVSLLSGETAQAPVHLERAEDYAPALSIRKGSFVGVSFELDPRASKRLSQEAVKEVKLIIDQDERIDGGDKIKLWS